jgi:cytochrome c oxidase assembly protein subunit 11
VGIATYNVTPDKGGSYFNKIDCFCFDEQRLPGKTPLTLPVQFFIDPDIVKDHPDVKTITLSYTFYEIKDYKGPRS